jgi:hypothetical protein
MRDAGRSIQTCFVPAEKLMAAPLLLEERTVVRVSVFALEYVARPHSQSPVGTPLASTAWIA